MKTNPIPTGRRPFLRPFLRKTALLGCVFAGCIFLNGCQNEASKPVAIEQSCLSESKITEQESTSFQEASQGEMEAAQDFQDASKEQSLQSSKTLVIVEPGDELKTILAKTGMDEKELLAAIGSVDADDYPVYRYSEEPEGRTYRAEGYIAPGTYEWETTADASEVASILLHSYDDLITPEMIESGIERYQSFDNVLRLASIVQAESSRDPEPDTLAKVAAVFVNRLDSGMQLQSDVTIFYLQNGLSEDMDADNFAPYYDTYIVEALPAGPIGSPSAEAIRAVLSPADTEDLFFVYDDRGEYYFAPDYETHLENCALIGLE